MRRGRHGNIAYIGSVLLLVAAGCGVKVITSASRPERPSWVDRIPVGPGSLYFIGIKTKAPTLEEGQKEATQDALGKVANYLGATVNYSMNIERKNETKTTTGYIKVKSGTKIIDVSVVDSYSIKTTYVGQRTIEEYDVYVLVRLPKDVVSSIRAADKEEKEKRADAAYELFERGMISEDGRMYDNALSLYRQALDLVPDTSEVVAISGGRGSVTNNIDLHQAILTHVQDIDRAMKRVFVIVSEKNMSVEREHSVLADNLSEALTNNGYSLASFPVQSAREATALAEGILSGDRSTINRIAKETGAMYIVAGRAHTTYSSMVMGQYCYYAMGDVKIIQAFGNDRTIENIPFKVSGFHQEKSQAGLNALSAAGKQVGETVVRKLDGLTSPGKKSGKR